MRFLLCFLLPLALLGQTPTQAETRVYFSPGGSPTAALVKELDGAKESVLVQAYSFTSAPIAAALKKAHERGVSVRVILDKSHQRLQYSQEDTPCQHQADTPGPP